MTECLTARRNTRNREGHTAWCPYKKAAGIEALKIVQEHRRWVSDESLKEVADFMEMSPEELDTVATFYNLIFRKPVAGMSFCYAIASVAG